MSSGFVGFGVGAGFGGGALSVAGFTVVAGCGALSVAGFAAAIGFSAGEVVAAAVGFGATVAAGGAVGVGAGGSVAIGGATPTVTIVVGVGSTGRGAGTSRGFGASDFVVVSVASGAAFFAACPRCERTKITVATAASPKNISTTFPLRFRAELARNARDARELDGARSESSRAGDDAVAVTRRFFGRDACRAADAAGLLNGMISAPSGRDDAAPRSDVVCAAPAPGGVDTDPRAAFSRPIFRCSRESFFTLRERYKKERPVRQCPPASSCSRGRVLPVGRA